MSDLKNLHDFSDLIVKLHRDPSGLLSDEEKELLRRMERMAYRASEAYLFIEDLREAGYGRSPELIEVRSIMNGMTTRSGVQTFLDRASNGEQTQDVESDEKGSPEDESWFDVGFTGNLVRLTQEEGATYGFQPHGELLVSKEIFEGQLHRSGTVTMKVRGL